MDLYAPCRGEWLEIIEFSEERDFDGETWYRFSCPVCGDEHQSLAESPSLLHPRPADPGP